MRFVNLAGLVLVTLVIAPSNAAEPNPLCRPPQVAIDPSLWQTLAADGEVSFLVVFREQAGLSGAAGLAGKEAKGRYVYDTLRAVATRSQAAFLADLRAQGADVRPFYVVNAVGVRGNGEALRTAAASSGVARIVADTPIAANLPHPVTEKAALVQPLAVEEGVSLVNADDVWGLGYTGTDIVIGNQDTGVLWNHAALKSHYRGWDGATADHDYSWHDSWPSYRPSWCSSDPAIPCDDDGHGTHTIGTMVGDDGLSNQVGVAPGAQWISCRNMRYGYGTPSSYLECFQWFLAPYPQGGDPATDGDPTRAPHIISNSWACPPSEGCTAGNEIRSGVQVMRAAGILSVVAAGNEGSSCGSVIYPPGIYPESFSVGAFAFSGAIASFSSRGPATVDCQTHTKPDIAAPGVNVRSSTRDGGYGIASGTSMATPHVAGAAALLLDAAPYLIGEAELTEWVLRLSAQPRYTTQDCGGDGLSERPNNVWGWGQVDALAAVNATMTITPTAAFAVTPTSGTCLTKFTVDASLSADDVTPTTDLLVRWDWENDGVWDTQWTQAKSREVFFTATATRTVTLMVADAGGRTDTFTQTVFVDPTYVPLRLYMPLILKTGC